MMTPTQFALCWVLLWLDSGSFTRILQGFFTGTVEKQHHRPSSISNPEEYW